MTKSEPEFSRFLPAYFVTVYGVFVLSMTLYLLHVPAWTTATSALLISALFFYALLFLLPAILFGSLTAYLTRSLSPSARCRSVGILTFLFVYPVHLLLLADAGLWLRWGYHINPHVINIFTTPGGFDSMGLRTGEIVSVVVGMILLAVIHGALFRAFLRFPALSFAGNWAWKKDFPVLKKYGVAAGLALVCFLTTFLVYAYEHFSMNPDPLLAADSIPLYIKGTSKGFFTMIGLKQPDRDATRVKLSKNARLDQYPQNPIERIDHPKYNVVWMACESFAEKMFTPEIMPETAEFAKRGVVFRKHYSGGNVTRQGVFSMFYGLPANYWHVFLAASRGPLLLNWMKEDGYSFQCVTSSKFSYPEFDRTVFFDVPSDCLYSDDKGKTYERDQRNVKKFISAIEDGAASGKPFFTFMFFESPHNPYEFPQDAVIFKDYKDPFNAATAVPSDGPLIRNRAANAVHHLDMCLAKVFRTLEKKDLLKNTIVVIAGDHGEEYFEHGYLGHSSAFVNEQTRTPLILYYPGIKPGEYTGMSSHLDIVPMLAKLFGVKNDPKDYSCGYDLLSTEHPHHRRYALIADWDQVFFAGEKYKSLIPLDSVSFAKQKITDADDRELDDVGVFYEEYNKDLIEVQNDLSRFSSPQKKNNSAAIVIGIAVVLILTAGVTAVLIRRRKKSV